MGDRIVRWRWHRYRRSLRTVPAAVLICVAIWALRGGGYFWPIWVILGGGLVIGMRASKALRSPHPDELAEPAVTRELS